MTNSMLATCAAIIAVAGLMTAATLSVGIAFAQPLQPPGPPGQPGPPVTKQVLQVTMRSSLSERIPAGEGRTLTAQCGTNEGLATGGGLHIASPVIPPNTLNPNILDDRGTPLANPTAWTVTVINPGPNPIEANAWVACTNLVDAP